MLPVTSVSYVLTGLAEWYFFTEKISWQRRNGYANDYDWRFCRGTYPALTLQRRSIYEVGVSSGYSLGYGLG